MGKERYRRLNNMADSLLAKRDEAVLYRASTGVERRWMEDQRALDSLSASSGRSMIDYATGEAPAVTTGPVRSMAEINVLRGKRNVGAGRFEDILFPTDDKNYGLKVTPVPTLVKGLTDERPVIDTTTGQTMVDGENKPVTASQVAAAKMAKATEAMDLMEDEIDDQLAECGYNGECREVIRASAGLGTGVLKGPAVVKEVRRAWIKKEDETGEVYVMETVEEDRPKSKWVDCRKCYPSPGCGSDIKKASYMWEYDEKLPRDVRALIGVEGYFDDVLMEILKEEPQRIRVGYKRKPFIERDTLEMGHAYEYWEYNGEVERDDLEALGLDVEDVGGKTLSACVVFINDRPVKVVLNLLDTMDMPYDFFQWEPVDGSPFGIGLIRMGLWMSRVITAAFRTMMDNGRDSAGANVIIGHGIYPDDDRWEITGKKIWRSLKEVLDVRKVFHQFQLQNNQAELQAIIELAVRFLDLETELPMMFQGEKAEMPETLGATNIILDSNNIGLRSRVKRWDDQITRPHLTRYYNWNMQYSPKKEIKGDFSVIPRGASALLEKDQQTKALLNIIALRNDGRFDRDVDWGKAVKILVENLRLDILKDEEQKLADEQAEKENPPQDPKIQVAQIRSGGEMEKAKLVQESDMTELKFKAMEAEKQRQHEAALKEMEYQIRMMEFAQEKGITLEKVKAELAKEASKQNLQRELSVVKASGPQVATPSVEPAGRAPDGQAYQK